MSSSRFRPSRRQSLRRYYELRGAFGGDGGSGSITEDPDTLFSVSSALIKDAVSEGQIYGLSDRFHPLRCISLDGAPMEDADGHKNFKNYIVYFLPGRQHQSYLPGFQAEESTASVGVKVEHATPWVHRFTDDDLDEIVVDLMTPILQKQSPSTGDITGANIDIRIDIQSNNGGYVTAITDSITGKSSGPYIRSYAISLAGLDPPWDIKVVRVSPDSDSELKKKDLYVQEYTEVIFGKLTHPNTALFGLQLDAKQFSSIPQRAYLLKGMIVNVPMNYDPENRVYASSGPGTTLGTWDGTFKLSWTNNPAWCWYDLAINKRYGLGTFISPDSISKFDLYTIGQYCDENAPDGFGGFEPRFGCNLYLQKREDAAKVLSDMASIFRGLIYYAKGTLVPIQDKPATPLMMFSPANVINGSFVYAGTSRRARHTVAYVTYNDMTDLGQLKPYVYEDPEQILKYGYNPLELAGFGCNSAMQARRIGKFAIRAEKLLTETVSFDTGAEGFALRPGAIIQILDPFRAGADFAGRIIDATLTSMTIDRNVTLASGHTYFLSFAQPLTGAPFTTALTNGPGTTNALTFITTPSKPDAGTLWQISTDNAPLELWRVVQVTPKDNQTVTVTALKYDEAIYTGQDDDPPEEIMPPETPLRLPRFVVPPTDIVIVDNNRMTDNGARRSLEVGWTPSTDKWAKAYVVSYRYDEGNWHSSDEIIQSHFSIPVEQPGVFDIKVRTVNAQGWRSDALDFTYDALVGGDPVADNPGGDYAGPVALSTNIDDAVIYYTTDASDPSDESNVARTLYSAPVTVALGDTLKYVAQRRGHFTNVKTSVYGAGATPEPSFSPIHGIYYEATGTLDVTLASAGADDIFYTLDNSDPTDTLNPSRTTYTAPITLPTGHSQIRAYAVTSGKTDSDVAISNYQVRVADA